ncbi:MAG: tRNA 2-selenouridine(34) synthase MnmH, partial [Bacteroidales bacterium]|nr:tRNA 2-selenouridine(34) synthase MnmH [Bacteroidales bacterium]
GSGKTDILYEIKKNGEQMIDLEGLAHHKGSAFGTIGQLPQPTNEQFENNLVHEWLKLDIKKRVWLEDESVTMGRCGIPAPLYTRMRVADLVKVEVPKNNREERLVREYANGDMEKLYTALSRISKKLGGLKTQEAELALENNDFRKVAEITLEYYDKAYEYGLNKRDDTKMTTVVVADDNPILTAKMILERLNTK